MPGMGEEAAVSGTTVFSSRWAPGEPPVTAEQFSEALRALDQRAIPVCERCGTPVFTLRDVQAFAEQSEKPGSVVRRTYGGGWSVGEAFRFLLHWVENGRAVTARCLCRACAPVTGEPWVLELLTAEGIR